MINKFLFNFSAKLPCRLIKRDNNQPYLERYYLGSFWGMTFYLHRFVSNDGDEHVHDHPWYWARSIVLTGWYYEESLKFFSSKYDWVSQFRNVNRFNSIKATTFHRIVRVNPGTWTLFFHNRRIPYKGWGFLKKTTGGVMYEGAQSVSLGWQKDVLTGENTDREPL